MNQETADHPDQLDGLVRNFSLRLSSTRRGARLARLLAVEQLRSWGLPLDPAAHIVAELAANAVTHGRVPGRDFELLLYVVADTLRIEVTDTRGDRLPELTRSAPDSDSGRGLLLVEALADRWGVIPGPRPRKTIWAELKVRTDEPVRRTFRSAGAGDRGRTDISERWEEREINRIIDERTANPAGGVPIEDVMRETLERKEEGR